MSMEKEDDDDRLMLVRLLTKPGDDTAIIVGTGELNDSQKLFLVCTCAAAMIERALCLEASYDTVIALRSLDAIVEGMRGQIVKRCEQKGR
jgi:hypothetical protein